jgi:hypothetical protein
MFEVRIVKFVTRRLSLTAQQVIGRWDTDGLERIADLCGAAGLAVLVHIRTAELAKLVILWLNVQIRGPRATPIHPCGPFCKKVATILVLKPGEQPQKKDRRVHTAGDA